MKSYLNNDTASYLNNLGLGLLGQSGYSTMPQSFGSAFAKAAQGANEQRNQDEQRKYQNAMLGLQLKKYQKDLKAPIAVGSGTSLIDSETYKPVYENEKSAFGSTPAALQLANEYEAAIKTGDYNRANNIIMFSKTLDKGVTYDQSGNPISIPGYGSAKAGIQATVKGAEQNAKNQSDLNYAEDIERAKLTGRGEIPDTDKRSVGQSQVDIITDQMTANYKKLNQIGGIIDPSAPAIKNIGAGIKSSALGQYVQGKAGTQEQSIRNQINAEIPALINSIRSATGMSAKAMDSNAELQFYLKQASDPKVDIQTNLQALQTIKTLYGKPIQNSRIISDDAQPQTQNRPSLNSIFGTQ